MTPRYSMAEARNHFAEIVHDLKHVSRVEVTRRGRPVAILISVEEFELCAPGASPLQVPMKCFGTRLTWPKRKLSQKSSKICETHLRGGR